MIINFDIIFDVRQELPSRILDLKAELECLKQGLIEEKKQFLQTLEGKKAKLAEEEVNLNIKLAARNMAKERSKARAFQEEVILVDGDCPEIGGGENCEEPIYESEGVHVEGEEGEGKQTILSENVEEREEASS